MLLYCSALFLEFDKSDGTKRSISPSFCFKLRRHKAFTGADRYNEGSWHEIISQNDQRKVDNDRRKE